MEQSGTFLALVLAVLCIYGLFELVLPSSPTPAVSDTQASEAAGSPPPAPSSPNVRRPATRPARIPETRFPEPVYAYHPGVNVDEAAARISAARPAVVMFFSTTCSLSQRAFPQFVELSRKVGPRVQVLAFTTDENEAEVQAFLNQHHAPFSADLLEPWPPGFFSRAMQGVGLHVGSVWVRPLVAVIGPDGRVLGQWQGIADLGPVERVIEEADL